MFLWHLGESQNVYATVTADTVFTVISCTCSIYQISDSSTLETATSVATPSVTITGTGTVTNTLYAKFTPASIGNFVAVFLYVVGAGDAAVTGHSLQIIEVLETI